jgi:hypothetical protein
LLLDPLFNFLDFLQRLIPSTFQFARYQAILGIKCSQQHLTRYVTSTVMWLRMLPDP